LKAFSGSFSINDAIIKDQIIPLTAQVASEKGIDVIDFYTAFEDSPHLYIGDGIHPNSSGAKLMAEMVAASLLASQKSPDFNGDGTVDIKDLLRLIESWGLDDVIADIAPTPFGDGVVDALDLETLMSYWEQSIDDPTLIAHWPLDETEGTTARDSVSGEDASVIGDPPWQPSGGIVDGALELDGVDDCVFTTTGINPSDGPFSVLVWINGGSPGQAIISQPAISDWLILDAKGNLRTELKSTGQSDGGSLLSDTIITDGDWHRIGLVWDGSYRCLYVDGAKVANDTEPLSGLESASSSLYIGVGKDYTAGTFFSGLIDDIRVYNRVVSP
jgi:hypothetical protein